MRAHQLCQTHTQIHKHIQCLVPSVRVCPSVLGAHACAHTHTRTGVLSSAASAELVFPVELISPARFTAPFSVQPRCASIWLSLSPGRVGGAEDGWQSTARGSRPTRGWSCGNLAHFSSSGRLKCFFSVCPSLLLPPPSRCPTARGLAPTLLRLRALPGCQLGTRPTASCRMDVRVTQLQITPSLTLGLFSWSRGG